ncbi:MAG TPA: ABC transporter substrate binding protein [Chloroflexota bacterium]
MIKRFLLALFACLLASACVGPVPGVGGPAGAAPRAATTGSDLVGLTVGGATPTPAGPAAEVVYGDWFKVLAAEAPNWTLTPAPGDARRLTLLPKDEQLARGQVKRVLVLYTRASSSYDLAISRILAVFRSSRLPVAVTVLNITRDAAVGQKGLDYAKAENFDLILSMGSDTTDFLVKSFQGQSIPVVTVCSKDPVLLGYVGSYKGSGTNIAYTSLDAPVELQMTYLDQLVPGLKNIAVLYSESNTSAKVTQVAPLKAVASARGITVSDVVVVDDKNAKAELKSKVVAAAADMRRTDPGGTKSVFWITGSTPVFNEIETIDASSGGLPVLSVVPDVVKEGSKSALLSIGITFESNAHLAALYAVDILQGKAKAGELEIGVVSPPDIAINFGRARAVGMKIPFSFLESASYIYDQDGRLVRAAGQVIR